MAVARRGDKIVGALHSVATLQGRARVCLKRDGLEQCDAGYLSPADTTTRNRSGKQILSVTSKLL